MSRQQRDKRSPDQISRRISDESNRSSGMSLSMHDGVEVWCDCCSCEAEPYWLAAFEDDADLQED